MYAYNAAVAAVEHAHLNKLAATHVMVLQVVQVNCICCWNDWVIRN